MLALKCRLWIITVCVLLSACAPTVSQQEITTALNDEVPTPPKQWTEASAVPVQVGWIDSFDDPVLLKLVQEAQANNLNLQAASANVERARALAVQAGAALTPSVDLALGAAQTGGNATGLGRSPHGQLSSATERACRYPQASWTEPKISKTLSTLADSRASTTSGTGLASTRTPPLSFTV